MAQVVEWSSSNHIIGGLILSSSTCQSVVGQGTVIAVLKINCHIYRYTMVVAQEEEQSSTNWKVSGSTHVEMSLSKKLNPMSPIDVTICV